LRVRGRYGPEPVKTRGAAKLVRAEEGSGNASAIVCRHDGNSSLQRTVQPKFCAVIAAASVEKKLAQDLLNRLRQSG